LPEPARFAALVYQQLIVFRSYGNHDDEIPRRLLTSYWERATLHAKRALSHNRTQLQTSQIDSSTLSFPWAALKDAH
jgi:hypothetical protein